MIEDACQAIGAADGSGRAGTVGAMGAFSFFPSKNLGGFGDGGLATTNDDALARQLRLLRGHGAATRYHHEIVGGNFRLDALQAAVLTRQAPAPRRVDGRAPRQRRALPGALRGGGVGGRRRGRGADRRPDAGRRAVAAGRAAGRDATSTTSSWCALGRRDAVKAHLAERRRRLRGLLPGAVPPAGVLRAARLPPRRLPDRGGGGGRFAGAADLSGTDRGAAALRRRRRPRRHDRGRRPSPPGRPA